MTTPPSHLLRASPGSVTAQADDAGSYGCSAPSGGFVGVTTNWTPPATGDGMYQPGPPAAGQTAAQVAAAAQQAATDAIATQVPPLIPKATSSRLYTQMVVAAGDAVNASTTNEQLFASQYTIPANSLIPGQAIHVRGAGLYSTSAVLAPSQRARLRLGGQTMVDSGMQNVLLSLSAARYLFDITLLVRTIGTAGTIEAFGLLHFATSLATTVPVLGGPSGTFGDAGNPVAVNTTQDMTLALSCTFSATSSPASGNTNQLRQLAVHTLRPVT